MKSKENNIRSEYIKNLVEDKDKLTQKLAETTKNTLKEVVDETINKQLRQMISEANDDYDVEEVNPDADDTTNDSTEDSVETDVETTEEIPTEDGAEEVVDTEVTDAEGGEDATADDDTGEDVWGGLEQYKSEDGEYDLTGMNGDDVIKVLKVMKPEDGVRVLKNDDGSITLSDDETDKEYIIDIDLGGEAEGEVDNDIEIDLGEDGATDECNVKEGDNVNEDKVDLGYTDNYQKQTAMTVDSNKETANSKDTYSMDAGVPTGTEKPWVGNKGDMKPFEEDVNETVTSTENSVARHDNMTYGNNNSSQKFGRNHSIAGKKVSSTSDGYQGPAESINRIKQKANAIYKENKELRKIAESIKTKLEEAIVVNSSLGKIIKLVTENSTTLQEKKDIINRFNNVKTINESKTLYNVISEELKKAGKVNNTSENTLDGQLTESKKTKLVENTLYQSTDLSATLSLMERLSKI